MNCRFYDLLFHLLYFLHPQIENQNRSYVVHSKASFDVIEMPYKNLKSDLPNNSTTVSSM